MSPEDQVLVPRHAEADDDDWPEFELLNVRVYNPDEPDVLVSLLEASDYHPLMLTGSLQPRYNKASAHLYVGRARSAHIAVQPVKLYAYGELEEGGIAIWAAGGAGWFGVTPAPDYRPIYETMVEAVKILYFVVDAHGHGKGYYKKKTNTNIDARVTELFERYAKAQGQMTAEQAAAQIYAHRGFLLASMVAGKEGMVWSRNPLFIHLSRKFPQDLALAKERINGPAATAPAKLSPNSIDASAASSTNKRKRQSEGTQPNSTKSELADDSASRKPISSRSTPAALSRQPSTDYNGRSAEPANSETDSATPTVLDTDEDDHSNHKGRKRKSALRLKPGRARKGLPPTQQRSGTFADEEDTDLEASRQHGRPQLSKRRQSRLGIDDGIDAGTTSTSSEKAGESEKLPPLDPPDSFDPVQDDTWLCALDGCTHKVYDASNVESQRLIRAHYELHAFDDDARVRLVQRLQAPSLPVKHLMERVKLQAKADGSTGAADPLRDRRPQHVVQRY